MYNPGVSFMYYQGEEYQVKELIVDVGKELSRQYLHRTVKFGRLLKAQVNYF